MTIPTLRNRLDSLRLPNEVVALLLALQVRDPDLSQLARLSDEDWRTLLAFCNLANLALPLARLPSQEFPKWVVEQLQANRSDNALRFKRVKDTYREAAKALDGPAPLQLALRLRRRQGTKESGDIATNTSSRWIRSRSTRPET